VVSIGGIGVLLTHDAAADQVYIGTYVTLQDYDNLDTANNLVSWLEKIEVVLVIASVLVAVRWLRSVGSWRASFALPIVKVWWAATALGALLLLTDFNAVRSDSYSATDANQRGTIGFAVMLVASIIGLRALRRTAIMEAA
jgi:hypothetical protein